MFRYYARRITSCKRWATRLPCAFWPSSLSNASLPSSIRCTVVAYTACRCFERPSSASGQSLPCQVYRICTSTTRWTSLTQTARYFSSVWWFTRLTCAHTRALRSSCGTRRRWPWWRSSTLASQWFCGVAVTDHESCRPPGSLRQPPRLQVGLH